MIRSKIIVIIFLFLFCNKTKYTQDIWSAGKHSFAEGEYSFLDLSLMKNIILDRTTEEELYQIFGEKINVRLTYNPPLPRVYKGKYIPIDRMVMYFDAKGITKEIPNGKVYENFERLSFAFYLYPDI